MKLPFGTGPVLGKAAEMLARVSPDPQRDARLLLAHAAGLGREELHRLADLEMTMEIQTRFGRYVARREYGEPVSRILGYRDFWEHRFEITPDVLDPRPDTELLVAEALKRPFSRLLDLGTGSGCIAISLLAARPGAQGVATDLSEAALKVAEGNARRIGVLERLELRRADWFEGLSGRAGGRFGLIISNPPYIAEAEMEGLAPDVRLFDPEMALTPGGDGLAPYRILAAGALARLAPGGWLMAEIGPAQGAAVSALWRAGGLQRVQVVADLDGRDRVVLGQGPG